MKELFMQKLVSLLIFIIVCGEPLHGQTSNPFVADRDQIDRLADGLKSASESRSTPNQRISADKQEIKGGLGKTSNIFEDARYYLMNGNQIVGNIYDYGGIAPGDNLIRNVNNMVWRGLGDIYQFAPYVAAEVTNAEGNTIHIVSDAVNDRYAKDVNPYDSRFIYGWRPLPEYVDQSSGVMASNPASDNAPRDGKPDSWPLSWYNFNKGQYVWPGYLRQDVPNADLEVLWGMDDRYNSEFSYYPVPSDSSIRGLGVKLECRALQWSNSLAQNCIFFVYTAQNYSEKNLDKVYFGMYGDVDVGGASTPENQDDLGFFISPFDTLTKNGTPIALFSRSLVYLWDKDGFGYLNIPTHYNGCKFLESPGNPNDGFDNDADRIPNAGNTLFADESQTDGVDNDGDWNPVYDDVGIDGVPNTQDEGENDAIPTAGKRLPDGTLDPLQPGEPHFELTDLDESDQIGLTAFKSWAWGNVQFKEDESVWSILENNFNDTIPNLTDINFMYGSGKISLNKKSTDGSIKRFSIALLMGTDLNDLLITARTVQIIYNQNYQFIRPPDKPFVSAVADDKKVTLYWDSKSEESVDPIIGKDFEGYVVYRSTNPQFDDINVITDGFGSPLLYKPLTRPDGSSVKFDVAKRPEPFFEDDTSQTHNDKWDPGEKFIDVNTNGKYDSTDVEDFYKGYAVIPYDQRGVAYYLGDNTGLKHSFVDSNNVINGQTYYYAVVAYDHGDLTTYPPTECTKRISIDPVTSKLTYDVNTVGVIPGPRVNGYIPPSIVDKKLNHISGNGTGTAVMSIINELEILDNASYEIFFRDSLEQEHGKAAQLNYAIRRVTPVTREFFLYDTNYVKIGSTYLFNDAALSVFEPVSGKIFTKGIDYVIDTSRGFIRKIGGSSMNGPGPYNITFRNLVQPPSTFLSNEEGNTVFDGLKLTLINDSTKVDYPGSRFVLDNGNFKYSFSTVLWNGSNSKFKYAPLDIQLQFTKPDTGADGKFLNPGDTLYAQSPFVKKIVAPFNVVNVTNDTADVKLKVDAIVVENIPATKNNNRWDPGEPIVILCPAPYRSTLTNTLFEVTITAVDTVTKTFDGDVYQFSSLKPFSTDDRITFSTQSAKYSPQLASTSLDKIKVVPNPYVAVNEIEPTDRLPGTTRGGRRIYFEHLPKDCTIRIYTLSGELVKELYHSSGIDNGREYWDLLNRDNLGVAYGVYIAHIDAKSVGEKIIKFALIK
jgi:hypothetical protein